MPIRKLENLKIWIFENSKIKPKPLRKKWRPQHVTVLQRHSTYAPSIVVVVNYHNGVKSFMKLQLLYFSLWSCILKSMLLKFGHSEKTIRIWNNLPLDLTFTKSNLVGDCFQFCGLLRKPELYFSCVLLIDDLGFSQECQIFWWINAKIDRSNLLKKWNCRSLSQLQF